MIRSLFCMDDSTERAGAPRSDAQPQKSPGTKSAQAPNPSPGFSPLNASPSANKVKAAPLDGLTRKYTPGATEMENLGDAYTAPMMPIGQSMDDIDDETRSLVSPGWETSALSNPVAWNAKKARAHSVHTPSKRDPNKLSVETGPRSSLSSNSVPNTPGPNPLSPSTQPVLEQLDKTPTPMLSQSDQVAPLLDLNASPTSPGQQNQSSPARKTSVIGAGPLAVPAIAGSTATPKMAPIDSTLTEDEFRLMYPSKAVPAVMKLNQDRHDAQIKAPAIETLTEDEFRLMFPSKAVPASAKLNSQKASESSAPARKPSFIASTSTQGTSPPLAPEASPSKSNLAPTNNTRNRNPSSSALSKADLEAEALRLMLPGKTGSATGDRDLDEEIDRLVNPGYEQMKLVNPGMNKKPVLGSLPNRPPSNTSAPATPAAIAPSPLIRHNSGLPAIRGASPPLTATDSPKASTEIQASA